MNKRLFLGSLLTLPIWPQVTQGTPKITGQCSPGTQFGSAKAPNRIRVNSQAGQWSLGFPNATLVVEDSSFNLVLPPINDYAWSLSSEGEPLGASLGPYSIGLSGQWPMAGCPAISRELLEGQLQGELRFRSPPSMVGDGNAALVFQLTHPDKPQHGFFADLRKVEVVSLQSRDESKIQGSFTSLSGKRLKATSGVVSYRPDSEILEVSLNHAGNSGGEGTTFHVRSFKGVPGIYGHEAVEKVDGRERRVMNIYQITKFSGNTLSGRFLWVPIEAAPRAELLNPEIVKRAKELAVFETTDMVTLRFPAPIRI